MGRIDEIQIDEIIADTKKACESSWFLSTQQASFDTSRLSKLLDEITRLTARVEELEAERTRYKSYCERIEGLPDCNTCADKWCCTKCPAPGENTRINCPLWREKITPQEANHEH